MNYTNCMYCSSIEKLANSTNSDTKLYTDCWLCDEVGSFVVADYTTLQKFNNYYVYGLFSFFLGTVLLCCNKFVGLYSSGWWILSVKGSVLIVLYLLLLYSELLKVE
jgi:hypothetical protein